MVMRRKAEMIQSYSTKSKMIQYKLLQILIATSQGTNKQSLT
jgi:hypothetical protein